MYDDKKMSVVGVGGVCLDIKKVSSRTTEMMPGLNGRKGSAQSCALLYFYVV
jgi:hypothetical protein